MAAKPEPAQLRLALSAGPPFSEQLSAALGANGVTATVVLTENRVRIVSTRSRGGQLEVRVARALADLGEPAVDAVAAFVRGTSRGREAVRGLIAQLPARPPRRRRAVTTETRGDYHDLDVLMARERERHFPDQAPIAVTWGRRARRRTQRSIRLGSYDPDMPLIRIHRRLDHPRVPGWFVGFVLYHELLHHELGIGEVDGRRVVHPRTFRVREATHPFFKAAQRWERDVLPKLLRARL